LKPILDELARVSCETPADLCAIRVLSGDGHWLEFRALHHRDPVQAELLRAALEERSMAACLGATAQVIEKGESLLLPAVDMDSLRRTYAGTPFGDYIERFPVSTVMVVPLRSRGSVFGVVTVARTAPRTFRPDDLRFLKEVADRAAAAFDNTNLLDKLTHSLVGDAGTDPRASERWVRGHLRGLPARHPPRRGWTAKSPECTARQRKQTQHSAGPADDPS
jgi:GAF domain-containing protein